LVEVERSIFGYSADLEDNEVRLIKGGELGRGNNKKSSSPWTSTDIYKSYGGSSDLWGFTLTYSDINASNFGVSFAALNFGSWDGARVDHIQVTVYYSLAPSADQGDISAKPNQPGKQELDESHGPDVALPTSYTLHHNYPNPFNSETEITYGLPKESHVRLTVYDLLGREVRTLVDGTRSPGFHRIRWDGRDQFGNAVSSSLYIYKLDHPDGVIAKGMLLLK
jgi:hypothetical protein